MCFVVRNTKITWIIFPDTPGAENLPKFHSLPRAWCKGPVMLI